MTDALVQPPAGTVAPGPRHVAIDLTPMLPGGENGGAKVFVLELVSRLARRERGTRFTLLTQAASHDELAVLDAANVSRLCVLGVAKMRLRGSAFAAASALLARAPRLVRRASAHVGHALHSHMKAGDGGLLRRLGADLLFCPFTAPTYRTQGVPLVCTIYDLQFHAHPEFFSVEEAVLRENAFRDACRDATALAAISDFSREQAIAFAALEPARIRTIALRISRRIAVGGDDRTLGALGLEAGRYLLYPANFWKHKNHERLLEAFALARREEPLHGMRLVLTGAPGARRDAVAAHARALGIAETVVMPGFVPDAQLAALLAGARALVFPSLYEGFGLPVLEAMAASVPVACSDGTALREIASGAAVLFDAASVPEIARALLSIASDEALRAHLVRAGLARAADYADSERMASEYWSLFRDAMAAARLTA